MGKTAMSDKPLRDSWNPGSPPLISVLLPNYNSLDLYAALDSVLMQDYPNIQLILIDDASRAFPKLEIEAYIREHCGEQLREWRVIVNSSNQGTVRTMNHAFKLAQGKYIFNLAGDDAFYDHHVLSDWVAEFQRTGAEVMTAKRMNYDETLEQELGMAPNEEQIYKIRNQTPRELFEEIGPVNFIFGCCTARSAECIERHGLCSDRYRLIDDHPVNLRLLRENVKIAFFDRIVIKYRAGGVSSVVRHDAKYEAEARLIQKYEVQPYSRQPEQARKRYLQWERKCRWERLWYRWGANRPVWFLARTWLCIQYPGDTIYRLIHKLCNRRNNDRKKMGV